MNIDTASRQASPSGTQSIQRALMLVRLVASEGRRGIRIQALTEASGLSPTTAFRMVRSLMNERVIVRDPRTRKLYLGNLIHELGLAAQQTPLRTLCHEALHDLAQRTASVVYLSDRSDLEAVCVDRAVGEMPQPHWSLDIGLRCPLGVGGGGLAILSSLPDDTVAHVVCANAARYASHKKMTAAAILRQVCETRRSGYARLNSVMTPGVVALGVAFRYGDSAGSLTVAAMRNICDERRVDKIVQLLYQARSRVEAAQFVHD